MEAPVRTRVGRIALVLICSSVGVLTQISFASAEQAKERQCTPAGSLAPLAPLPEASGLALSRQTPGRLWTHNDSGQPVVFALDSRGTVTGQVQVTGAKVEDWESIAVGSCGTGSCLYLADIGDNEANRRRVTVYRVPEPDKAGGSAAVSAVFHAIYPDGAHDAETLLATGDDLYIVTKGDTGPVAVYKFPARLEPGGSGRLQRVAEITAKADADSRITDGSVSPDGQWVVLRSRSELRFYRASELFAGLVNVVSTVDVRSLKEPQGEGVALGSDNSVYLAGEGGGKGNAGTFAHFSCALPRK